MIGMYKNAKFLLEATPWIAPSRPWFGQKWPARDWTSSSRTRRVRRRCKGTKEGRLNYFPGVSIGCPSLPHPVYSLLLYWLPRTIPALEKRLNFVAGFRICWLPSPLVVVGWQDCARPFSSTKNLFQLQLSQEQKSFGVSWFFGGGTTLRDYPGVR